MQHGIDKIASLSPVEFVVPDEYSRLTELAYNFWWSWNPAARMLFSSIHPELWSRYRNPVEVLLQLEPNQWEPLLVSESFNANYERVISEFDSYMDPERIDRLRNAHPELVGRTIAYLSMEYGLHACLGTYSGGLGVLSGDHCKAASDLGLQMVSVGLFYRRGYFRQTVDSEGRQQHFYPDFDTSRLPIQLVLGPDGLPLTISVPLLERDVQLRVFKAQVGRVPVLLLDSDIPQNAESDRPISHILYVSGRELRLCQEMLLGIGAVRCLKALRISPAVWHVNEGHSVLMQLERMAGFVRDGASAADARERAQRDVVFTTHTPVPAGNETFDAEMMRRYLQRWETPVGRPVAELMADGRVGNDEHEPFNMTAFALRMSAYRNGVSEKHAEVSRGMWKSIFSEEPPIHGITNGIHVETWLGLSMRDLFERYYEGDWREETQPPRDWARVIDRIPDQELWAAHLAQKRRLIRVTRSIQRRMFARHGAAPHQLAALDDLLDPNVLTIGFARRFALYKRADLLFRFIERAKQIISVAEKPVQLLFAGKAHPADLMGQELISKIFRLRENAQLHGRVLFLEDYDMDSASLLVQGVDAWLNNPRRPMEASGTSGQKAAANGAMNISILDGWWIEGYKPEVGWAIGDASELENADEQDDRDAEALLALLENEVIPLYYERDEAGLPRRWIRMMKANLTELLPQFSARRMLEDYTKNAYAPLSGVQEKDATPS